MDLLDDVLNSTLQPYYKRYAAGECLFRQGEEATTMYFLVNGRLQLHTEKADGDVVEAVLETGQFLGERILLQANPFKRTFSAVCETDILVLQLTQEDVVDIEDHSPEVMTDLLRTVLKVVGGRFEMAGLLAQALRPLDAENRIAQVLRYYARAAGPQSSEEPNLFALSEDAILKYIDTDKKTLRAALKSLLDAGVLAKTQDLFFIPDEEALLSFFQPTP
jgi:CRP-like cAMP-binding protein